MRFINKKKMHNFLLSKSTNILIPNFFKRLLHLFLIFGPQKTIMSDSDRELYQQIFNEEVLPADDDPGDDPDYRIDDEIVDIILTYTNEEN